MFIYYKIKMLLRIVSAEWELYKGDVLRVMLPTESWYLWILPWHINLVTPLVSGKISYLPIEDGLSSLETFADNHVSLLIDGGLAMIDNDIITIAAE